MTRHWAVLLDRLYEMGGYGAWKSGNTERPIEERIDLTEQTELSSSDIEDTVRNLQNSGLVDRDSTRRVPDNQAEETDQHPTVRLTETGFSLAQDRAEGERNRRTDRSIGFLTLALAVVSLAQAGVIAMQAGGFWPLVGGGVVTFIAGVFLYITYSRLYESGILDVDIA